MPWKLMPGLKRHSIFMVHSIESMIQHLLCHWGEAEDEFYKTAVSVYP